MSMEFTIVRPGGNDTCLIFGTLNDPLQRKRANDAIMRSYPSVEQVGFVSGSASSPQLMMAGGEFCGNATRSAAALLLEMRSGAQLTLNVSGVDRPLAAGINRKGCAFADMPVYADPKTVTKLSAAPETYLVEMEGITHYIIIGAEDTSSLNDAEIKSRAFDILNERRLTERSAAGVMYVSRKENNWKLDPIVYVRDIDTLFRETACGSGTTALGLALALKAGTSIQDEPVIQPTGLPIYVSVQYDGTRFAGARICGPVSIRQRGVLEMTDRFCYVCERVRMPWDVENLLETGGLRALYRTIFSKAPYYESFTDDEIDGYFKQYAAEGLLYIARIDSRVIGFGAAVPLRTQPPIAALLSTRGLDPQSSWYMADLGVDERYRRNGVAKALVTLRMNNIPKGNTVVMRTATTNTSSQSLYRALGFTMVEGAFQQVRQQRTDGSEVEDTRLFLAKQMA